MKNKRPTSNKFESELSNWSLKKGNKLIITSNSSLAESTYRKLEKKMDEVVLLPHTETLPYDFFRLLKILETIGCKLFLNCFQVKSIH